MLHRVFLLILLLACLGTQPQPAAGFLNLSLRSRVEVFRGSGEWTEVHFAQPLVPDQTALIICDMWDKHWCAGATRRVKLIAQKAVPVVARARQNGILIIHAPSDTMDFYKDAPQRSYVLRLVPVLLPTSRGLDSPPLPIDDTGGGCDTPGDTEHRVWTREISTIPIAPGDAISDNGREVYTVLKTRKVSNVLVMGVHANMCILNRSFAIKQLTNWGIRCILLRDLTDAMYDPNDYPHVTHQRGTELVIEYIEKYWAPSTTSEELLAALPKQ